jgi:predicted permease
MLSSAALVSQGVAGAGVIAGLGVAMKHFKLVPDNTGDVVAKLIYWSFNPAFTFYNIAQLQTGALVNEALIAFSCIVVVSMGLLAGGALVLAWGEKNLLNSLMILLVCGFSNVSSLPLHLAGSLPMLRKPDIYSYLTSYIATQSLLMWGCFYPVAVILLRRQQNSESESNTIELVEKGTDGEEEGQVEGQVEERETLPELSFIKILILVFNPQTLSCIFGIIVALIPPLQAFLFGETFTLFSTVTRTLGDANVPGHLLILGIGLIPLKVVSEWPLLLAAASLRLIVVPALVFVFLLTVLRPLVLHVPLEVAWVPLTLASTPTNLGILVIALMLGSKG